MKLKAKNYTNMWSHENSGDYLKVSSGNYENYCKKVIDNLCMEADLAENLNEYVRVFADGMYNLIKMGIPKVLISKHNVAISKILRLGEDIIEHSEEHSDTFYIGLFVDHKVHGHWYNGSFYKIISNMFELVLSKCKKIPEAFKIRIEELIKLNNYPLYALYFVKNRRRKFIDSA